MAFPLKIQKINDEKYVILDGKIEMPLGEIVWHKQWHHYCFLPMFSTMWTAEHLAVIWNHIERLGKERHGTPGLVPPEPWPDPQPAERLMQVVQSTLIKPISGGGRRLQVAWIPAKFAVLNAVISIKNDRGHWSDGWEITHIGESCDDADLDVADNICLVVKNN